MSQPLQTESDFDVELSRLHVKNQAAGPESRLLLLGAMLTAAGLVLLVVALASTRQAVTLQQQVDGLALAPLGLGITLTGTTLWLRYSLARYLRFWLIRLIYQHRQSTDRPPAAGAGRE
ncbi:hypothetical protein [Streptomyces sp. NBC_01614]|uniref:hypothetical protein n=1 Tax=Streptomyces sp. NBC_01614 TaxID=2975897 RepID=UPI00386A732E